MPSNMRQFFSKSKGTSTQSPDLGASASATCAACGSLIRVGQRADNISMPVPEPAPAPSPPVTPLATPTAASVPPTFVAMPAPAASSLTAPTPVEGTESQKSHSTRDNLLNGASITLSVLADVGAISKVPFLKDVANVTKKLVDLIQTVLQNIETLRELIRDAIGLGQCIIDAINACFTAGESLPEVFEQHVRLLLDTLTEVKDLCFTVLKESKAKKAFNVKSIKDKTEAHRRRIKAGLEFFQLRSNISVEAHFAKWTKFLEEQFPLNGFKPQPAPAQTFSNVNNSQTHTTNAPVNSHSFNCYGGIQAGLGNQMNVMGVDSSIAEGFDGLALQRMILSNIPPLHGLPRRV